jgi:hypothetical protein
MIRKNIVNVALGILLIGLIMSVIKINNPENAQKTKITGTTSTESIKKGKIEGRIWLSPINQDLKANQNFDMEIVMDAGKKNIGAFNLNLNFDTDKINIDTTKGVDTKIDTGRGFNKGPDAKEYVIMSNSNDVAKGKFRLAGMGVTETANGTEKHMITIHAKTTEAFISGQTEIILKVNEFSDTLGNSIVTEKSSMATVTVK